MSDVFFISESNVNDVTPIESLTENTDNGKKTFITGIFAQAEIINGNRRIYPRDVLFNATEDYIRDAVSKRNAAALGELNHPVYPMPNAKEACHIITELSFEGNDVIGKAEVLEDLDNGKIVKTLLDRNVSIGVSTRGLGESKSEATHSKITKFKLTAVDVVTDPSAPNAFVKGIMEGLEWIAATNDKVDMDIASNIIKNKDDKLNAVMQYLNHISNK